MRNQQKAFGPRVRAFVLGSAAIVVAGSLSLSAFSGDSKNDRRKPAKVAVDKSPIDREGDRIVSFAPVVKRIGPSVVNVYTTSKAEMRETSFHGGVPNDDLFRRFFGDRFEMPEPRRDIPMPKRRGVGSGVIVTEDGYILTNAHVVQDAEEIRVVLSPDKKEYEAEVVGADEGTDIAVLKVEAEGLPAITMGDSEQLEIGDLVLALGNPFGIGQTVTMGMVGAKGRATMGRGLEYQDFIQTDAAINPGNSGGALVDAKGRLVGVNTAILSRSGGNNGIGFAVPVNLARSVMQNLIEHGRVVRGYLGVLIQDVTPALAKAFDLEGNQRGAVVSQVQDGGAAAKAGVKAGDVIVEFNGREVRDVRSLKLQVAGTAPNTRTPLKVVRDGEAIELDVRLKELPGDASETADWQNGTSGETEKLKGVGVEDLSREARRQHRIPGHVNGPLVATVDLGSAAYEAGLRPGDVILEMNRQSVEDAEDAIKLSRELKSDTVLLRVWSDGGSRYLVVEESDRK